MANEVEFFFRGKKLATVGKRILAKESDNVVVSSVGGKWTSCVIEELAQQLPKNRA